MDMDRIEQVIAFELCVLCFTGLLTMLAVLAWLFRFIPCLRPTAAYLEVACAGCVAGSFLGWIALLVVFCVFEWRPKEPMELYDFRWVVFACAVSGAVVGGCTAVIIKSRRRSRGS